MKEKRSNAAKPKTPKTPPWDKIAKFPIRLYQTAKSPIMGLFERNVTRGVRLWAPAWVNQPGPSNVIYMPIFPVETYLDLYTGLLIGESPAPEIVLRGYAGYIAEFIKGSYKMNPVVVSAGIDAPNGVHGINDPLHKSAAEEHETLEACPGCQALLSNWQAHYPVLTLHDEESATVELATENDENALWLCEMHLPDVRQMFPNYTPPFRPLGDG